MMKRVKLVNYTPHAVTLIGDHGQATIPPCGQIVRATSVSTSVDSLNLDLAIDIPVVQMQYGEPENVPEYEEGTINIVSSLALAAIHQYLPDRKDFVVPSDSVRDADGQIIGCRSLAV